MQKLKSNTLSRYLAIIFLSAYLWGSFSNMFYIPRYTFIGAKASNGLVSGRQSAATNFHSANLFRVIDRATVDCDQLDTTTFAPKCLLLIFIGFGLFAVVRVIILPDVLVLHNFRRAYLSFCTFRI